MKTPVYQGFSSCSDHGLPTSPQHVTAADASIAPVGRRRERARSWRCPPSTREIPRLDEGFVDTAGDAVTSLVRPYGVHLAHVRADMFDFRKSESRRTGSDLTRRRSAPVTRWPLDVARRRHDDDCADGGGRGDLRNGRIGGGVDRRGSRRHDDIGGRVHDWHHGGGRTGGYGARSHQTQVARQLPEVGVAGPRGPVAEAQSWGRDCGLLEESLLLGLGFGNRSHLAYARTPCTRRDRLSGRLVARALRRAHDRWTLACAARARKKGESTVPAGVAGAQAEVAK